MEWAHQTKRGSRCGNSCGSEHSKHFKILGSLQHQKKDLSRLCKLAIIRKMAIISVCEDVEKETVVFSEWECKLILPLWKMMRRLLRNLNSTITRSSNPAAGGVYPKEAKTGYWRDVYTCLSAAVLLTAAKTRNSLSVHWWMNG